ncbi:hypothetical protein [Rhizobium terrae]|uniref:hypothetical protein n=1 Tax=Rhizobium terrae TaxID=2171756 RepID=UPI000E3EDA8D|nr:hypothetical protein [Rhizobium terrae]
MDLSEDMLERVLLQLSEFMSVCRDPWCIFGGAAMYLHGFRDPGFSDIDVLASLTDVERIAVSHALRNEAEGGTQRFRSQALLHPDIGDIAVEIMAGFEIFADGRWQAVTVADHAEVRYRSATVWVASPKDVGGIFRLCGRPKDIERLGLLEQRAG